MRRVGQHEDAADAGARGAGALVDQRIDADVIRAESLRPRPAPDLLLAACERLQIRPGAAVTFTHSAARIAAGHSAGMTVVGVGEDAHARLLSEYGAERVVRSLGTLLDRSLLVLY